MMKVANKLCMVAVFSVIGAATAMADCTFPKKPSDPPNGSEAAKRGDEGLKEMVAAQRATKQFDADVKSYQACLDSETQDLIKALGDKASAEEIQRVKDKQVLKANTAYEDALKVAEAFNVQLRAYKAK